MPETGKAEPDRLVLQLNPNGVAAPAQRIVIIAAQVVGTLLRALARDDLSEPDMQGGQVGYRFDGLEMDEAERRATYENWVLSNGFRDLARGIRESLEEAYLYLKVANAELGPTTLAKVQSMIEDTRARAAAMRFPQLLEEINAGLTEPMAFEPEFRTLQKVRNCLEHRGGIVGPNDVDVGADALTLSFPRLKMFYLRGEDEIEIVPGEAIDTHEPETPFADDEGVQIYLKRVTRTRTYARGQPVQITAAEFYEIAMACHMFAADVATKLPILPPLNDTSLSKATGESLGSGSDHSTDPIT